MILCCGEALIDMIPETTISGESGFVPHAGGAVFNTAIALGRLGVSVGMISGISTDMFGQILRAELAASKVDDALVIASDRPSTLAFVHLRDGHATYSFYDEETAGRMLLPADMPSLPTAVEVLYFGGISLACEPGADAYAALLEREGTGRAVMIDPNIRPGFIQDEARYRARLSTMIAQTDIVKVSDEDLDWLLSSDQSLEEKARTLLTQGPALVIVTQGAAGASCYLADGRTVHAPANKVQVVDTVGAGDTFNAGALSALSAQGVLSKPSLRSLSSEVLEAALRFGAKVSAVTVSRAGANPPWEAEL